MKRTTLKIGLGLFALVAFTPGCEKENTDQEMSASGIELSGEADYSTWYGQIVYELDLVLKNVGKTRLCCMTRTEGQIPLTPGRNHATR